jgi:hypothetical protein
VSAVTSAVTNRLDEAERGGADCEHGDRGQNERRMAPRTLRPLDVDSEADPSGFTRRISVHWQLAAKTTIATTKPAAGA